MIWVVLRPMKTAFMLKLGRTTRAANRTSFNYFGMASVNQLFRNKIGVNTVKVWRELESTHHFITSTLVKARADGFRQHLLQHPFDFC